MPWTFSVSALNSGVVALGSRRFADSQEQCLPRTSLHSKSISTKMMRCQRTMMKHQSWSRWKMTALGRSSASPDGRLHGSSGDLSLDLSIFIFSLSFPLMDSGSVNGSIDGVWVEFPLRKQCRYFLRVVLDSLPKLSQIRRR